MALTLLIQAASWYTILWNKTTGVQPMKNKITHAEMERRKAIIAQVDANNRLEDITPAQQGTLSKELQDKWIKGEITLEEGVELIKKHHGVG